MKRAIRLAGEKPPYIALMGPTASGKTALAMELVQQLPLEIVSVDSAMVYRGMDIGTGQPTAAELAIAPHHLIDVCDPADAYSAARFAGDAKPLMADIRERGNLPLLVGGTFLYFRALAGGLHEMPEASRELRAELAAEAAELGWPALHATLAAVDPVSAERIHSNDGQRIQRALEVWRVSGRTLTHWHQARGSGHKALQNDALEIIYAPADRVMLHRNIERRFDAMLNAGFLAEVNELFLRGDLDVSMPSVRSVGYRQLWSCLAGDVDEAEARFRGIVATRQLAKRQFTWLRNQQASGRWFDAGSEAAKPEIFAAVQRVFE